MASDSNIVALQPRNHRRSRVLYVHGATVVRFPKDFLSARADSIDRQAARILARSFALNLQAYAVAVQVALCIAGLSLHPHKDGASACKKIYPRQGKPSVNAEDQA